MKRNIHYFTASLLALGTVMGAAAAPLMPEAGKFYRIKHVSGLYLTDDGFKSTIADKEETNRQIVEFVPVEGEEGLYDLRRVSSNMYIGTDLKWNTTAIYKSHPQTHMRVVVAADPEFVLLQNTAMKQGKECFGVDNTTSGSAVYTDKNGADAVKHLWTLEEAQPYEVTDPAPEDKYAEYDLPDSDIRKEAYDGYKLVFAQEFSNPGKPDVDVWKYETGYCRNKENQYYDGDNSCYVQDGVLVIEGKNIENENRPNPKYVEGNNNWPSSIGPNMTWTSGSMQTKGNWNSGYTWQYGIYEVRAKVPQYVGSWPAIWSTGMQYEWPYGGEIDIMEYYGNRIHANVCWGDGGRWSGHWNSATVHDSVLGEGWGDEYHIWRMIWDEDHMELWCDELLVNNIDLNTTNNDKPSANFNHGNGCNPFRDVRQMLWLNLALGGQNGGSLAKTPRYLYYLIDYARVYQKVGSDGLAKYKVDDEISEPTFAVKDGEPNEAFSGVATVGQAVNEACLGVYNLQGIRVASEPAEVAGSDTLYIVVTRDGTYKAIL